MKVKNKDFYIVSIPTRNHRKKRINKKWLKRYGIVQKLNVVNKNGRYYDISLLNDNQILAQYMKKIKGESDHVS